MNKNASTGVCSPCTEDGQYQDGYECKNCDETCRLCSGPQANECTACYSGTYLYSNTCVSGCPDGYDPNEVTWNCDGKYIIILEILIDRLCIDLCYLQWSDLE